MPASSGSHVDPRVLNGADCENSPCIQKSENWLHHMVLGYFGPTPPSSASLVALEALQIDHPELLDVLF